MPRFNSSSHLRNNSRKVLTRFTFSADTFSLERVKELMEENSDSTSLSSVFRTIKTTYELHGKISSQKYEMVVLKVVVKITPEIRVVLGEPKLHV